MKVNGDCWRNTDCDISIAWVGNSNTFLGLAISNDNNGLTPNAYTTMIYPNAANLATGELFRMYFFLFYNGPNVVCGVFWCFIFLYA